MTALFPDIYKTTTTTTKPKQKPQETNQKKPTKKIVHPSSAQEV